MGKKHVSSMDQPLRDFSDTLKQASDDFTRNGVKNCERVLKVLKSHCRSASHKLSFSIGEVYYAGSVGKRMCIAFCKRMPDIDLVVKLNKYDTNADIFELFKCALDFFTNVLTKNSNSLKIQPDSIATRGHSLVFVFEDGMSVDLLPGQMNLSLENIHEEIYKRKNLSDPMEAKKWSFYSSSMVFYQVQFMKTQGSFAHRLGRLAKYWLKTNKLTVKVDGGSLMMELLAVAVVKRLRKRRVTGEPMLKGFCDLMRLVADLNGIQIAYKRAGRPPYCGWALRKDHELDQLPEMIQTPFIVEPTNPCNNLLENMSNDVMNTLSSRAEDKACLLEKMLSAGKGSVPNVHVEALLAAV